MESLGDSCEKILGDIKCQSAPALENSVVLTHLFSHMRLKELKVCRQVCSKWRDISDPYFEEEGNATIFCTTQGKKPNDFLAVFSDSVDQLPFSGFTIWNFKHSANDPSILDLFVKIGKYMKRIVVKIDPFLEYSPSHKPVEDLINLLFIHAPGIENLRIAGLRDRNSLETSAINHSGVISEKFSKLKSLQLTFGYDPHEPRDLSQNNRPNVIKKLINCSENLRILKADPWVICKAVFNQDQLNPTALSKLKILEITENLSYHPQNLGQSLTVLASRGLRIESFSLAIPHWDYEGKDANIWLPEFLQRQSSSLKSLAIKWPNTEDKGQKSLNASIPKSIRKYFSAHPPKVPVMDNVLYLDLECPFELAVNFFNHSNTWISLFPKLITLTYVYNVDRSYREVPQLVQLLASSCHKNIQRLILKPTKNRGSRDHVKSDLDTYNIDIMFRGIKRKFQNLRQLTVYHEDEQVIFKNSGGLECSCEYKMTQPMGLCTQLYIKLESNYLCFRNEDLIINYFLL